MASPTRFSSTLGKRSIAARLVAVLALAVCGVAIYFVVISFTESDDPKEPKNENKGRSEQAKDQTALSPLDAELLLALS